MDKHTEISECAYYIWERKGCPQGIAIECWLEAENELRAAATVREHMKGEPNVAAMHHAHFVKAGEVSGINTYWPESAG